VRKGFSGVFLVLAAGLACDARPLQPGEGAASGLGGIGAAGGTGEGTGAGGQPGDPVRCAWIATGSRAQNPCGQMNSLAYSPDGQLLVGGTEGPRPNVRIWRLSDGARLPDIDGVGDGTIHVAFSPDGQVLATAGGYRIQGALSGLPEIVKLWSVADGSSLRTIPATCGHYASTAAFSHDGALLVTAGFEGPVEVWRVRDGSPVASISYPRGATSATFSPDDTKVIIAGVDNQVTVWNLATGTQAMALAATSGAFTDAEFSPDASQIATTGPGTALAVWDGASGSLRQTLQGHDSPISHVVWLGGDRLITNERDGRVLEWTRGGAGDFAASGRWLTAGPSLGIAVSPDQTTLAVSGGADPGFWLVALADLVR
jgi:WD40 repeat protein